MAQSLNITRNLSLGSTGPDVMQLQQYLKSQGFFPANQPITNSFGPITEQAVAAWQAQNNIPTNGNPGSFGPNSRTFVMTNNTWGTSPAKYPNTSTKTANSPGFNDPFVRKTASAPRGTNSTGNTGTDTSGDSSSSTDTSQNDALQQALKLGFTAAQFAQLSPDQQALLGIVGEVATNTYSNSGTGITLDEALNEAKNDPTIVAKYADQLSLDKEQLLQNVTDTQTALSSTATQQATQFENERKQLALAQAGAGTAYSGFRGEAQRQLAENENAIVTSSRAQAQTTVNNLTSAFETKYGSAATVPSTLSYTNPLTANGVSLSGQTTPNTPATDTIIGQKAGGIVGTQAPAESADVLSKANDLYTTGQLPALS